MILDSLTQFSLAQALTATALSTDAMDLSQSGRPVANTVYHPIVVSVAEPMVGAGTLEIQVVTSDNDDMSGADVLMTTGPIAAADLDGSQYAAVFDLPDRVYKRYLGLNYVVAGGAFTGGSIDAAMAANAGTYRTVARGYVIE